MSEQEQQLSPRENQRLDSRLQSTVTKINERIRGEGMEGLSPNHLKFIQEVLKREMVHLIVQEGAETDERLNRRKHEVISKVSRALFTQRDELLSKRVAEIITEEILDRIQKEVQRKVQQASEIVQEQVGPYQFDSLTMCMSIEKLRMRNIDHSSIIEALLEVGINTDQELLVWYRKVLEKISRTALHLPTGRLTKKHLSKDGIVIPSGFGKGSFNLMGEYLLQKGLLKDEEYIAIITIRNG